MNRRDALKAGLVLPLVSTANASEIPNGLKEIKFNGSRVVANIDELFKDVELIQDGKYHYQKIKAWLPKYRCLVREDGKIYYGIVQLAYFKASDKSECYINILKETITEEDIDGVLCLSYL
jgi:hypothetical protein